MRYRRRCDLRRWPPARRFGSRPGWRGASARGSASPWCARRSEVPRGAEGPRSGTDVAATPGRAPGETRTEHQGQVLHVDLAVGVVVRPATERGDRGARIEAEAVVEEPGEIRTVHPHLTVLIERRDREPPEHDS